MNFSLSEKSIYHNNNIGNTALGRIENEKNLCVLFVCKGAENEESRQHQEGAKKRAKESGTVQSYNK